jgi:hypothetical protein
LKSWIRPWKGQTTIRGPRRVSCSCSTKYQLEDLKSPEITPNLARYRAA